MAPFGSSERDGPAQGTVDWVTVLAGGGAVRDAALAELHGLLVRVARSEMRRRSGTALRLAGPELDDLAHQAADDALLAIIGKLGSFRGESRFTTWAYRFVILEVSSKLGRHFSRPPAASMDDHDWERLPDRLGTAPADQAQQRDLVVALRTVVEEELTERQRLVFTAIVVDGVPVDALAVRLDSHRNALYKTMFDARRKIRGALVATGYLAPGSAHGSDHVQTPPRR